MSSSTNMTSNLRYISCPVSQLDLLEPVCVQTQIEGYKDIEYLPTSVIQDRAPIIFEIGKDERYSDLSELVIKTAVEIQGPDGTSLEGKQFTNATEAESLIKVGVINNFDLLYPNTQNLYPFRRTQSDHGIDSDP